jgi:hypothetical protein
MGFLKKVKGVLKCTVPCVRQRGSSYSTESRSNTQENCKEVSKSVNVEVLYV